MSDEPDIAARLTGWIGLSTGAPGALMVEAARALADSRAARGDLLAALQAAERHIEHMAAWIGQQNAGYSFESLGEDMPGIRAAIAKATKQAGPPTSSREP